MARPRRTVRLSLTGRGPLRRAETLLAAGRRAEGAKLLVAAYLSEQTPDTAAPHEDLIDAVGCYVRAVDADPAAVPDPLGRAGYAYQAAAALAIVGITPSTPTGPAPSRS